MGAGVSVTPPPTSAAVSIFGILIVFFALGTFGLGASTTEAETEVELGVVICVDLI